MVEYTHTHGMHVKVIVLFRNSITFIDINITRVHQYVYTTEFL